MRQHRFVVLPNRQGEGNSPNRQSWRHSPRNAALIELMAADALGAPARDELGLTDALRSRPVQAALASLPCLAVLGLMAARVERRAVLPSCHPGRVLGRGGDGRHSGGQLRVWQGGVTVNATLPKRARWPRGETRPRSASAYRGRSGQEGKRGFQQGQGRCLCRPRQS